MPPVIVGNVSLKTNLDHNRHQLYCEAFEYICESSLQGLQSALAKFARLAVGEVNKFGVSNRQHARCIPQVETFSKLALGYIDCAQVIHTFSRLLNLRSTGLAPRFRTSLGG